MTTGTHKPATQTQAPLFHAHRELLSVLPQNRLQHQHRHGDVPQTRKRRPAQSRFSTLPASRRPVPLTTKRHLHLISISSPSSIPSHQLASPRPPPQRPIAHDSPGPESAGTALLSTSLTPGRCRRKIKIKIKIEALKMRLALVLAHGLAQGQARTGQVRSGQVRSGVVWTDLMSAAALPALSVDARSRSPSESQSECRS